MEVANNKTKPKFSVAIRSEAYQTMIKNTLGDTKTAQKFIAEITTVVGLNQKLQDCDTGSIVSAGLMAQSLNLTLAPTLGLCYVIPYGKQAQFQIGWKGLVQLAIRTGQYRNLGCNIVYDGEYQGLDEFGEPVIRFSDNNDNKKIIGYMAYLRLINGFTKIIYWDKAKCERHGARYSQTHRGSARGGEYDKWSQEFDSMALKTVIKQLIGKWGVLSTELENALKYDQAVIGKDNEPIYIDNPIDDEPPTPTKEDTPKVEQDVDDNIFDTIDANSKK